MHSLRSLLVCAAVIGAFLYIPLPAAAHVVGYAAVQTNLVAHGSAITLHTEAAKQFALGGSDPVSRHDFFTAYFSENFSIAYAGNPCTFALTEVSTSTFPNTYVFEGVYTCASPVVHIEDIKIHSSLFREDLPSFDHFVSVDITGQEWEIIFGPAVTEYPGQATARAITALDRFISVAKEFTWMGMMHIYTGYDHILFLISIILLTRSLKKILLLVTSFTVAHSITLLLASFHIIFVPSGIVEPVIALSIAYMAMRNYMVLRSSAAAEPMLTERWLATFGFGLIHGLGFAGALADTRIPQEFFTPALLIFNLGIELGQLTILIIVVPVLLYIDKKPFAGKVYKVISIVVGLLALLWFFERLY